MKKKEHATKIQMLVALGLLLAALGGTIFAFFRYYSSNINETLYTERINQMDAVTGQLFRNLDNVIETRWLEVRIQSNLLEINQPQSPEELYSFISAQQNTSLMNERQMSIVAVDSAGHYYTSDGIGSSENGLSYIAGTPSHVSYVDGTPCGNGSRLHLLLRLSEPIVLRDGDEEIELIYYGTSQAMEHYTQYFTCDAYDGSNSVYVLDRSGYKIFNSGSTDLLRGCSAYAVLESMEYLHGCSFEETLKALDERGIAISNAVLDGTEYYYALRRVDYTDWTLLFLIPSPYVAQSTVQMVKAAAVTLAVFAAVLLILSVISIALLLRVHHRRELTAEHQRTELQAKMNAALTAANERLSQAKKAAECAMHTAENANRAKSNFLANISHDVRTPMNAIVGLADLLEHNADSPERVLDYTHKIQSSSRHMLGLISDLLDMAKLENGKLRSNIHPMDLRDQINQIETMIRPQAEKRRQELRITTENLRHTHLLADELMLRRVLINILSNAVKYTPDGGRIEFNIEELERENRAYARFRFTVTDNGVGMSKEFLSHIFEPFSRAEASTVNPITGTGLGMAIAKSLVEAMNGAIRAESCEGKGSMFEFIVSLRIDDGTADAALSTVSTANSTVASDSAHADAQTNTPPLSPAQSNADDSDRSIDICDKSDISDDGRRDENTSAAVTAADSGKRGITEEYPALRGMKLICAEDNELNAEILKSMLELAGAVCRIYPNGRAIAEAFDEIAPENCDLVLMDIQMPEMNGYDAARAIRSSKNPYGRTVPIIAMTANAFSDDVQRSIAAGMNAHLSKPVNLEALERAIIRIRSTPPPEMEVDSND